MAPVNALRVGLAPAGLHAQVLDGRVVERLAGLSLPQARRRMARDGEQPAPGRALPAKGASGLPCRQERLLQQVLAIIWARDLGAREPEHAGLMTLDEEVERPTVAGAGPGEQGRVGQCAGVEVRIGHVETPSRV